MSEIGIMLHTDHTAEKVKFEVIDGKTTIDNKEFIVDRIKPIMMKEKRLGRTRFKPFYILKWDKIEPANIQVQEISLEEGEYAQIIEKGATDIIRTLDIVFPEKSEGDILPEMLKETHDLRFMKHLKRYAAEGTGGKKLKFSRWMLIPVALIASGAVVFLLNGGKFF
jgi:hypothetical protein